MLINVHPFRGSLAWVVRDDHGVGVATSNGRTFYRGKVSERLRAATEALAEWHRRDRQAFKGESFRKVSTEIRRCRCQDEP